MAVIKAKIVNDKFNNFLFPFTKTNVPKKRLVKAVIKVRMLVILTIKIQTGFLFWISLGY